ncbi:hypothetical protein EDB86DRAFT_3246405 [Lactarius hatsudake]|nr:hypothetical protein EDB86DRAFT_3246405 [Lactarius hatsudake]
MLLDSKTRLSLQLAFKLRLGELSSTYWCGMPAVHARSLTPASLRLTHNTLAITLSLSYPHSNVPIHPFVCGRGGPVRGGLTCQPSPLCAWAAGGWTGVARAEGWACHPSSRECGRGAWGWAGVARAEEGWAVHAVPPLVCVDGAGPCALSVLLRTQAGRGAWGWAGVACAKEGWAVRAIPPLACVDGAGLDAPSVLLCTRAGQGAWGWAGVARAKGWAHLPSSRVCGQGRAGRDAWGWAGDACAEGDWGGYTVLRALAVSHFLL